MDPAEGVLDVHVVVAGASEGDELHAHKGQLVDDCAAHVIVDEHAHRVAAFREAARLRGETRVVVVDLVPAQRVRCLERGAVVFFCIVKGEFHAGSFRQFFGICHCEWGSALSPRRVCGCHMHYSFNDLRGYHISVKNTPVAHS